MDTNGTHRESDFGQGTEFRQEDQLIKFENEINHFIDLCENNENYSDLSEDSDTESRLS